jgi:hypothetical protein
MIVLSRGPARPGSLPMLHDVGMNASRKAHDNPSARRNTFVTDEDM